MVDSSDGNGNGHNGNGRHHSHELPELPAKPTRRQVTAERLARFLALYIERDFNGVRACVALGMKRSTAEAHAHRYVEAIRSNLSIQHAMRESGLDTRHVSRKLAQMMDAKEPKWNLATKTWDTFENTTAQLEAIKQTARLLNLYPAEPTAQDALTVNVIIDVKL
jgi:hypothetical protein